MPLFLHAALEIIHFVLSYLSNQNVHVSKQRFCYENDKITAKVQKMHKTQLGYLYESQITKWTFHHNRVCKLKLERFPVLLLITWVECIKRN